mgnify:CR=1 FL=1
MNVTKQPHIQNPGDCSTKHYRWLIQPNRNRMYVREGKQFFWNWPEQVCT